jgi:hypothetical protein
MRKSIIFFIIILFTVSVTQAQELNCHVQVITAQIQVPDPTVFTALQKSIFDFMNTRRWTADNFQAQERIPCNMVVSITKIDANNVYEAELTVQSSRTAFRSSYNTTMLNYADGDFKFQYIQYQPLNYTDNTFTNNLSSMLAFYAYIMIGLDYDSFSAHGGDPYFQKAQSIVNTAQNAGEVETQSEKGWKAFESTRNRYWIAENLVDNKYDALRQVYYKYHRLGLDEMYDNTDDGRANIMDCLTQLKSMNDDNPNSMMLQLFFNAKSKELVQIFAQGLPDEKTNATTILTALDPTNATNYQTILKQ